MWPRRSETLAPLTRLTSKDVSFQWTDVKQQAFDKTKQWSVTKCFFYTQTLINLFIISQDNHPIALYSRKLQAAQVRYTTIERELLLIIETLKEFHNILLGQQIVVHTDHQNLTHKNFNTERIMQWHHIIEEFRPTMEYIKGPKNIVANSLNHLEMASDMESLDMADCYDLDSDDLPDNAFLISYTLLDHKQKKDKTLLK